MFIMNERRWLNDGGLLNGSLLLCSMMNYIMNEKLPFGLCKGCAGVVQGLCRGCAVSFSIRRVSMFRHNNGVLSFIHQVTKVEWVAYSIESALTLWAFAHGVSFREAVMVYERS